MSSSTRRDQIREKIQRFFKDFDLLFNAANQLDDPEQIIKLIKKTKDDKIIIQLIFRLAYLDEEKLLQLLTETDDEIIKQFGIFIIQDQQILKEIALNFKSIWTALSAVSRISDQHILFEIASNEKTYSSIRWEALRRINDESLLLKLVDTALDDIWIRAIITKIETEEALLTLRLVLPDRFQADISRTLHRLF